MVVKSRFRDWPLTGGRRHPRQAPSPTHAHAAKCATDPLHLSPPTHYTSAPDPLGVPRPPDGHIDGGPGPAPHQVQDGHGPLAHREAPALGPEGPLDEGAAHARDARPSAGAQGEDQEVGV